MEFTKIEEKILSTKHEKFQKAVLWIGILFFILSIAPVPYMLNRINKVKETWEESYLFLDSKIKPETKQEIFLKSKLLKNVREIKEISVSDLTQKLTGGLIFLFFIGCYFILIYFISRNYLRLIRKLQNS
jgi:preprotein translocase subunit SecG